MSAQGPEGPETEPSAPVALFERGGSTERLAEHYAGRLGETIVFALESPKPALARLARIREVTEEIVAERKLHRSLAEYRGGTGVSRLPANEARNSGSFHGLIAVADEISQRLEREGVNESATNDTPASKDCKDVAAALLNLDFEAALDVVDRPVESPDGVEAPIVQSYMFGVREILSDVISTVRARLQRRVTAIFDSPKSETRDFRLATLLFIALTNYPLPRVTAALGREYGELVSNEEAAGEISRTADAANSPLALTQQGQATAKQLLRKTA